MKKSESFISLRNVSKIYSGNNSEFAALKNISLSIAKGSFTIIQGASGSGKSTLLNILAGIDAATMGQVMVDNVAVNQLNSDKLARWRGSNVGIVFQFFQLMPTLTVLENVMLPMEFAHIVPKKKQKAEALELLQKVKIEHLASKLPHTLSGGEKQRVAIARSLANRPEIIVADEPTGNLDSANTKIIHELFNQLHSEGKTIIYVTHERVLPTGYDTKLNMRDGVFVEIEEPVMEGELV